MGSTKHNDNSCDIHHVRTKSLLTRNGAGHFCFIYDNDGHGPCRVPARKQPPCTSQRCGKYRLQTVNLSDNEHILGEKSCKRQCKLGGYRVGEACRQQDEVMLLIQQGANQYIIYSIEVDTVSFIRIHSIGE